MTWWPGWDSIESAAAWSHFWFWFGIFCLFALGASEVVSHVYGLRKDELVAAAEVIASKQRKADQDAADARHSAEIGGLKGQLTEAQKAAAEASKKADAVSQQAAPRHLTSSQEQAISAAIAPFRGTVVDVVVPMGDSEAKSFAAEFVALFRKAGWDAGANDAISQAVYTGTPTYGVQVTLNETETRASRLPNGAEALIRALIAAGLTDKAFVNPGTPAGKIEFRVGTKEPK